MKQRSCRRERPPDPGRAGVAGAVEKGGAARAQVPRDLEALSAAGLPVYAQPGRGGGWQLLGGGRTDLSGLNAAETRALFLLAGPHTRLAPEAKSALRKLVRALPEPSRKHASAAAEAVADVDARRTRAQAVVLASQEAAAGLLHQFGGDARVGDRRSDGRVDVHLGGASTLQLAERLAGWGDGIEVIGPLELRRHLAEIGARLVEACGRATATGRSR